MYNFHFVYLGVYWKFFETQLMKILHFILFSIIVLPNIALAQQDNPELQKMYDEDQSARMSNNIDWTTLSKQDKKRENRVFEMIQSGKIVTAKDYYNSAMIFQHGNDTIASSMAVKHMKKAVELDPTINKWLLAAAIDRDLMRRNQPQIYGTQFIKNDETGGKFVRYKIDSTKITDVQRIEFNVETLKEQKIKEQLLNATSLTNLLEGKTLKERIKLIRTEYKKGVNSNYDINLSDLILYVNDLLDNEKINEASEIAKLCVQLYPNESYSYISYGAILLKQNYKQDAIKVFYKALELNPNDTDIRAILNHID